MYLTGNGFGSTPMKQSELSQLLNLIFSRTLNVHFTPLLSALRSARKCITANPPSIIIGKHLLQHCRTVPIKRLHVLLMCECVVLRNKYTHILKSLHICTYAAKVSLKSERYTWEAMGNNFARMRGASNRLIAAQLWRTLSPQTPEDRRNRLSSVRLSWRHTRKLRG